MHGLISSLTWVLGVFCPQQTVKDQCRSDRQLIDGQRSRLDINDRTWACTGQGKKNFRSVLSQTCHVMSDTTSSRNRVFKFATGFQALHPYSAQISPINLKKLRGHCLRATFPHSPRLVASAAPNWVEDPYILDASARIRTNLD